MRCKNPEMFLLVPLCKTREDNQSLWNMHSGIKLVMKYVSVLQDLQTTTETTLQISCKSSTGKGSSLNTAKT